MTTLTLPKKIQPYVAFLLTLSETHLASLGSMIPHRATPTGFFKDRLSVDIRRWCPLPHFASDVLRHDDATRHTRSAFVGSHHLDGFLHQTVRRLVASYSRP